MQSDLSALGLRVEGRALRVEGLGFRQMQSDLSGMGRLIFMYSPSCLLSLHMTGCVSLQLGVNEAHI